MTVQELNIIYDFCNKLCISIKSRDNVLTYTDYAKMMKTFPISYKLCNKLYENRNDNNILSLLAAPLLLDVKSLGVPIQDESIKSLNSVIGPDTQVLVDSLLDDLGSRLSDETIIPTDVKTSVYTSAVMINLSTYMKQKQKAIPVQEMRMYDYMDFFNEESSMSSTDSTYTWFDFDHTNENDSDEEESSSIDTISESVVGFTTSAYSMLTLLYRKAIVKYVAMVNSKRLHESEYNILPGPNMLSCYPIVLGMIYSSSLMDS